MDINKAKQAFLQYVAQYDIEDEQIHLKVVHTMNVCKHSVEIAKAMKLSKEDQELAYVIGLLHDIGRFEQLRNYHTFLDSKSVNHARLGVHILQERAFIRNFVEEKQYDAIILQAIEHHNRFRIEEGLDARTLLHTHLLRDSDKADIFRVDCCERCEILFLCSIAQLQADCITEEVYQAAIQGSNILASKRKTNVDIFIAHISLLFDIKYQESLLLIKQQGYFETLLERYTFQQPHTQRQYHEIKQKLRTLLNNEKGMQL